MKPLFYLLVISLVATTRSSGQSSDVLPDSLKTMLLNKKWHPVEMDFGGGQKIKVPETDDSYLLITKDSAEDYGKGKRNVGAYTFDSKKKALTINSGGTERKLFIKRITASELHLTMEEKEGTMLMILHPVP